MTSFPKINQKVVVAIVYVSAMLLNTLDTTIINIALSTLAREFDVSPASIESVVIGYLVSLAVFIPVSGWVGDRFGMKRTFLVALAIFTIASLISGFAQSLPQLVLFRILQGAGGGMLTPVGMAMLYRTFPPQERIGVGRILMFATILGPALGPIIGGVILENWPWPWIFFVKVPVGLAALLFGLIYLEEQREEDAGGFDFAGFLLGGLGFAIVMYALSEGPQRGWGSPFIIATLAAGVLSLVLFVRTELRLREPMIQLRLFQNRLFRTTLTVSFFGSAAFIGVLYLVPLFLQEALHLTPFEAGITTAPEAIGVVTSTQVVARIYPRVGPRRLMSYGLAGVAISIFLMALIQLDTSIWIFRLLMFALGASMACLFLPNQAASLATVSRRDTGRATTLTNVQRQLGSALGVALLSTVLSAAGAVVTTSDGSTEPNLTAYRLAFIAAGAIAVVGAVIAQRVPDEDAANTMIQRAKVTKRPSAAS
ncbi:MAG TPA: DHA2 family efflux MFS transporter permease subunit [Thermomicrobiales bacterium]|nr:DHA2 family efflux MFS transporter permease subunit [Thermomicrobiales bacterium]